VPCDHPTNDSWKEQRPYQFAFTVPLSFRKSDNFALTNRQHIPMTHKKNFVAETIRRNYFQIQEKSRADSIAPNTAEMHLPKSLQHRFYGQDGRKSLLNSSSSSEQEKAQSRGPKRHSDPLGLSRSLHTSPILTNNNNTTTTATTDDATKKFSKDNQDCHATRNLKTVQSPDGRPPVTELVQRNGVTVVVKRGEHDLHQDPALLSKGIKALRLSSVAHKLRSSTSKTLSRVVLTNNKFAHIIEDDNNADTSTTNFEANRVMNPCVVQEGINNKSLLIAGRLVAGQFAAAADTADTVQQPSPALVVAFDDDDGPSFAMDEHSIPCDPRSITSTITTHHQQQQQQEEEEMWNWLNNESSSSALSENPEMSTRFLKRH
jgi:hypothetical protein